MSRSKQPQGKRVALPDVELAYFEWGDAASGATVLLIHATGFHARCWDGVVRSLGARAGHVVALDLRGHGRSSKTGPYPWSAFGADVAAFVAALDLQDVLGVGHSMGGHALVQAAAEHPSRFARLLLVDPTILDPATYRDVPSFASAEEHPVARRRNRWQSAEEMIERFEGRTPFSLWNREVLEDYCRHGLNPAPDGDGLVLGCPPLVEASIYLGSAGCDVLQQVAALRQPVTVLRARNGTRQGAMDFSRSPTWPGLAAAFANGRDVHLPELTHFIPMQRPDLVAGYIDELTSQPGPA